MPEIFLHSRKLESVFELLGTKENNITYTLGWVMSRSPGFLQHFLARATRAKKKWDWDRFEISLQEHSHSGGFTDIEIRCPGEIHIIIEAKRGWNLPTQKQLEKYLPRFRTSQAPRQLNLIVALSECSQVFAAQSLPTSLARIPVRHLNWHDLFEVSQLVRGSHAEMRLMEELRNYLKRIVNMQNQETNRVFIVVLSREEWAPGLNFVQVVEERKKYFHPMGTHGWPKEPPNYIAFRYNGRLQTIHHIEKAEVIRNFHRYFPERPNRDEKELIFLYSLGPAIKPPQEVKTGKIFRSGRKWAMLDLLLTSKTIAQACERTKARLSQ